MDQMPHIVNDPIGDDRSWTRNTWSEVINLFQRTVEGGLLLKNYDKDNYLPDKLFFVFFKQYNIFS